MADSPLLFPSLNIENYRAFSRLQISRLGRVNLVVGKNNVGKSSLLEALLLYSRYGSISTVWDIATARSDTNRFYMQVTPTEEYSLASVLSTLQRLFRGRPELRFQVASNLFLNAIRIESSRKDSTILQIEVDWLPIQTSNGKSKDSSIEDGGRIYPFLVVSDTRYPDQLDPVYYRLDRIITEINLERPVSNLLKSVYISAKGYKENDLATLYDNVAATNLEDDTINSLQIIEPKTERIRFVESKDSVANTRQAVVKLLKQDTPFLIQDMGDGMQRLLGISLALVNSKDGILLIDEIENGLHHSVLVEMWRIIFETAQRLNVQVFATTHSWDCISAFQRAAVEAEETEGMLISLRRKEKNPEEIFAVTSDEEELTSVVELDIEVR